MTMGPLLLFIVLAIVSVCIIIAPCFIVRYKTQLAKVVGLNLQTRPKFYEGQKIQLIRPRLAFIGGVYYTDMEVLIQPFYILRFFKETEKNYLFNVIINTMEGDELNKDNLVYFEKSSFAFQQYTNYETH